MEEQEFNKLMAKLDGKIAVKDVMNHTYSTPCGESVDYFNDLNLLMPLAWKHGAHITAQYTALEVNFNAYIQAIRECLIKVAEKVKESQ